MGIQDIFRYEHLFQNDLLIVIGLIFALLLLATLLFWGTEWFYPKANVQELKDRTKSWWVMAGIFFATTLIHPPLSFIAIAFLSFVAFRELYSLLDFRISDRRAILWAILAIPVQYYLAYIGWYGAYIIFIPVVMFLVLPIRFILKGDPKGVVRSMAQLQWLLLLTVFGISHMAYLLSLPPLEGFQNDGRALLLFLVFLTEINDVLQFTWGKLFGRYKIVPKISPNKTWEGFLGGVLTTTLVGYGLGFLVPLEGYQTLLVSFMIAVAGFVGDVVVSAIKRDKGTKDMGDVIPGHGGVLDRVDSLSYTAPVFFHLIYYIAY